MAKRYRKIFGDSALYRKFALTEDEIAELKSSFAARLAVADRTDRKAFNELVAFLDVQLAHIGGGRYTLENSDFMRALTKIESLGRTLVFEPERAEVAQHGQKFTGERIEAWSVPRSTGMLLNLLVARVAPGRIIEIGTSIGYSTIWMAAALCRTGNAGIIDTIDNLPAKVDVAKSFFHASGLDERIVVHQADALTYLRSQSAGSVDFIFLDADKERYGEYLDEIERILTKNGIMVADNVFDFGKNMVSMLDKLKRSTSFLSHLIELDNGLVISKKC